MLCGSYISPPRDKTACQTSPCKCKICISSIESDVYNKKKIQMFVVNMTFISTLEVKKCIFHSCLRHSWNIHFFTSLDEIKVIFTPNIWISSIYIIIKYFSRYSMKYTTTSLILESGPTFAVLTKHFANYSQSGDSARIILYIIN